MVLRHYLSGYGGSLACLTGILTLLFGVATILITLGYIIIVVSRIVSKSDGEGSSDNEYSVIDGYTETSIFKYNDTSYLAEHNDGGDDGCTYDLGIAKQEFAVDDTGNLTLPMPKGGGFLLPAK